MLQMKDALLNELSQTRSDLEQTVQSSNLERSTLQRRIDRLVEDFEAVTQTRDLLQTDVREREERARATLERHTTESSHLRSTSEQMERDLRTKVQHLERELERSAALTKTLQEVIETREADDRKNVVLMQLLNNQLDENKRRSTEVLEEERTRSRKLLNDLQDAELKVKHLTEENSLHRKEKDEIRKAAEESLHDYKSKLDQVKFDVKFLHSELNIYKSKLTKQSTDAESRVK
jgi:chromosome segregation ATPase